MVRRFPPRRSHPKKMFSATLSSSRSVQLTGRAPALSQKPRAASAAKVPRAAAKRSAGLVVRAMAEDPMRKGENPVEKAVHAAQNAAENVSQKVRLSVHGLLSRVLFCVHVVIDFHVFIVNSVRSCPFALKLRRDPLAAAEQARAAAAPRQDAAVLAFPLRFVIWLSSTESIFFALSHCRPLLLASPRPRT